jgi:hypothetical protein
MTDEQIIAATAGERRVLGGPIHLADYDPSWPRGSIVRPSGSPRHSVSAR